MRIGSYRRTATDPNEKNAMGPGVTSDAGTSPDTGTGMEGPAQGAVQGQAQGQIAGHGAVTVSAALWAKTWKLDTVQDGGCSDMEGFAYNSECKKCGYGSGSGYGYVYGYGYGSGEEGEGYVDRTGDGSGTGYCQGTSYCAGFGAGVHVWRDDDNVVGYGAGRM